jgi:FkbM family methyltransferase
MIGSAVGESHLMYFTDQGLPVRGVVHVGANDGAEVEWYLDHVCTPVLCFEPHPDAFERGLKRWWKEPVTYIRLALGETAGQLTMHLPENGDDEKTSRYHPIPTLGHDWTAVPLGQSLKVPVARFDEWAKENEVDLEPFNALVVDVQGMELEVLRGFGECLNGFAYLCVELSHRPVYEGEASADEVVTYLAKRGFWRETEIEEHDDVLFAKA